MKIKKEWLLALGLFVCEVSHAAKEKVTFSGQSEQNERRAIQKLYDFKFFRQFRKHLEQKSSLDWDSGQFKQDPSWNALKAKKLLNSLGLNVLENIDSLERNWELVALILEIREELLELRERQYDLKETQERLEELSATYQNLKNFLHSNSYFLIENLQKSLSLTLEFIIDQWSQVIYSPNIKDDDRIGDYLSQLAIIASFPGLSSKLLQKIYDLYNRTIPGASQYNRQPNGLMYLPIRNIASNPNLPTELFNAFSVFMSMNDENLNFKIKLAEGLARSPHLTIEQAKDIQKFVNTWPLAVYPVNIDIYIGLALNNHLPEGYRNKLRAFIFENFFSDHMILNAMRQGGTSSRIIESIGKAFSLSLQEFNIIFNFISSIKDPWLKGHAYMKLYMAFYLPGLVWQQNPKIMTEAQHHLIRKKSIQYILNWPNSFLPSSIGGREAELYFYLLNLKDKFDNDTMEKISLHIQKRVEESKGSFGLSQFPNQFMSFNGSEVSMANHLILLSLVLRPELAHSQRKEVERLIQMEKNPKVEKLMQFYLKKLKNSERATDQLLFWKRDAEQLLEMEMK